MCQFYISTLFMSNHTIFFFILLIFICRYHYFLQLKSDVMEGRLRCSYNEAIVLAGYRLQGIGHYLLHYSLFLTWIIYIHLYFTSWIWRPWPRKAYCSIFERICARSKSKCNQFLWKYKYQCIVVKFSN